MVQQTIKALEELKKRAESEEQHGVLTPEKIKQAIEEARKRNPGKILAAKEYVRGARRKR